MGHIKTSGLMMYTCIDVPPGGATNDSFDRERLFCHVDRIADIYNSIGDISK